MDKVRAKLVQGAGWQVIDHDGTVIAKTTGKTIALAMARQINHDRKVAMK